MLGRHASCQRAVGRRAAVERRGRCVASACISHSRLAFLLQWFSPDRLHSAAGWCKVTHTSSASAGIVRCTGCWRSTALAATAEKLASFHAGTAGTDGWGIDLASTPWLKLATSTYSLTHFASVLQRASGKTEPKEVARVGHASYVSGLALQSDGLRAVPKQPRRLGTLLGGTKLPAGRMGALMAGLHLLLLTCPRSNLLWVTKRRSTLLPTQNRATLHCSQSRGIARAVESPPTTELRARLLVLNTLLCGIPQAACHTSSMPLYCEIAFGNSSNRACNFVQMRGCMTHKCSGSDLLLSKTTCQSNMAGVCNP